MAAVTVFVDDAVRGRFPAVCAYDGGPADKRVRLQGQAGGGTNPLLFLLVFLGPLGWLVLLLMWGSGGERFDVLVPVCEDTRARWQHLRRQRWLAVGAIALTLALAWRTDWAWSPAYYLVAAAVAWALYAQVRLHLGGIDVNLDASRRWVTMVGVSNEFARAVVATQQDVERR